LFIKKATVRSHVKLLSYYSVPRIVHSFAKDRPYSIHPFRAVHIFLLLELNERQRLRRELEYLLIRHFGGIGFNDGQALWVVLRKRGG